MGWVRRKINGVKFKPTEMDAMLRACDIFESNCESVLRLHQFGLKQPDIDDARKEFCRDMIAYSRRNIKAIREARRKWYRVCLGFTDIEAEAARIGREGAS